MTFASYAEVDIIFLQFALIIETVFPPFRETTHLIYQMACLRDHYGNCRVIGTPASCPWK
jgi:hypothetical protein